ncbi:MAG: hypothetical protein JXL80_02675 [Planctomycetes bacterium]|nr:hypothetical protein [Planctomycetota bacterium]
MAHSAPDSAEGNFNPRPFRRAAGTVSLALLLGGLAAMAAIAALKGDVPWRGVVGDVLGACLVEIAAVATGFYAWPSRRGKLGLFGGAVVATGLIVLLIALMRQG